MEQLGEGIEIRKHPVWPVLVSSDGRVRRLDSSRSTWTYGHRQSRGYLQVTVNAERHKVTVHRLVAETFIPNPENLPTVDHIDRNKHNNNVGNLRWASRKLQQANTDRADASRARYGVTPSENRLAYSRANYALHREERRKYASEYYQSHKEEARAQGAAYRAKHHDNFLKAGRNYRATHKALKFNDGKMHRITPEAYEQMSRLPVMLRNWPLEGGSNG